MVEDDGKQHAYSAQGQRQHDIGTKEVPLDHEWGYQKIIDIVQGYDIGIDDPYGIISGGRIPKGGGVGVGALQCQTLQDDEQNPNEGIDKNYKRFVHILIEA